MKSVINLVNEDLESPTTKESSAISKRKGP
ncbi:MAG: hypothetical protein ACJARG_000001 [Arcticibacterium sp.]